MIRSFSELAAEGQQLAGGKGGTLVRLYREEPSLDKHPEKFKS